MTIQARAGSRCVVLTGLITREGAADPQDAHMTRLETGNECAKWGELLRVHVPCSAGGDPDGLGGFAAWSKHPLGRAPARLLHLLGARLAALDSSALPG